MNLSEITLSERVRSAATLTVLTLLVLVASVVGVKAAFAPLPKPEKQPDCIDTQVKAGDEVFPDQVTVSVFNGSRKNGLAATTIAELEERGFHGARTGNSQEKIKGVQIWAQNAKNPAVALVADQFRGVKVQAGPQLGPGVVLVIGDNAKMRQADSAKKSVKADATYTICTPPAIDELTEGN